VTPPVALRGRLAGTSAVDRWGYDAGAAALVDPIVSWRRPVAVRGAEAVPASGPTVVVLARGLDPLAPLVAAAALRRATGRPARFLGVLDLAPVGPLLRRLGGAVDRPEELAALLRAGHLVVVPLGRTFRRRPRPFDEDALVPAIDEAAAVVPGALVGSPLRRSWRLLLGPAVPAHSGGPGELAAGVRTGIQALLDG
jgi:hypothetical protein